MDKKKKLSKQEAEIAGRIGRRLAERSGFLEMTEGDIDELIMWSTHAFDLKPGNYNAYRLKVYKSILEQMPDYKERLVDSFYREVMASED